jgi:hypothetical protein
MRSPRSSSSADAARSRLQSQATAPAPVASDRAGSVGWHRRLPYRQVAEAAAAVDVRGSGDTILNSTRNVFSIRRDSTTRDSGLRLEAPSRLKRSAETPGPRQEVRTLRGSGASPDPYPHLNHAGVGCGVPGTAARNCCPRNFGINWSRSSAPGPCPSPQAYSTTLPPPTRRGSGDCARRPRLISYPEEIDGSWGNAHEAITRSPYSVALPVAHPTRPM